MAQDETDKRPSSPSGEKNRTTWHRALPALPILCFLLLSFANAWQTSVTVDEFAHLPAGLTYWERGTFETYHHNPPLIRLLAALPVHLFGDVRADFVSGHPNRWAVGQRFMEMHTDGYHQRFLMARTVIIGLTGLAALLFFLGVRMAFGFWPAFWALCLFCFDPNLLAHGGLVTTDAGLLLVTIGLVLAAVLFFRQPEWRRLVGLGLVLGAALLTKFTALLFVPILVGALLVLPWAWERLDLEGPVPLAGVPTRRRLLQVLCLGLIALTVLNMGYLFGGTGSCLRDLAISSGLMKQVAASPLGGLPLPLPGEFVLGIDDQLAESSGHFLLYFLGRLSTDGWLLYFPVALLLKTPLPILLLAGWGLYLAARSRVSVPPTVWWILGVAGSLFLLATLFLRLQVGLRYLLFLLPALHLLGGIAAAHALKEGGRRRLFGACVLLVLLSALVRFPHYIGSFSLLVGGGGQGHRYLADSNLDWGQDLVHLKHWMERRDLASVRLSHFGPVSPEAYGIEARPLTADPKEGPVVISINHLLGIHPFRPVPEVLPYLRREPTTVVGRTLWVFEKGG